MLSSIAGNHRLEHAPGLSIQNDHVKCNASSYSSLEQPCAVVRSIDTELLAYVLATTSKADIPSVKKPRNPSNY